MKRLFVIFGLILCLFSFSSGVVIAQETIQDKDLTISKIGILVGNKQYEKVIQDYRSFSGSARIPCMKRQGLSQCAETLEYLQKKTAYGSCNPQPGYKAHHGGENK